MKHSNRAFIAGAIFGFLGVITGAMGAHALESLLTADQLDSYETAVCFQMYHAMILLFLGVMVERHKSKWIEYAILSIVLGTIFFSGSIYLLVLTSVPVGLVTPIGGLMLMLGWGFISLWAIGSRNKI